MRPLTRILLPVNLESHVWKSIEHGARLASQSGAVAELLYVVSFDAEYEKPMSEEIQYKRLLSLLAMLNHRFTVDRTNSGQAHENAPIFVGVMQRGDPTTCILEFAAQMDHKLIVMGSSGCRGNGITESVVRSAVSPVLVVPDASLADHHETEWVLPVH